MLLDGGQAGGETIEAASGAPEADRAGDADGFEHARAGERIGG
ncbi:hypothetical protein ABT381_03990 [Streptomyces sp. NPDC000151]